MSYRELDERANRLAHHLRARIGSDGGRIGVLVERSPDMVIALLAIWKAGFAYVPLDPAHPQARLRYILSNADVSGVVTGGLSAELTLPADVAVVDLARERQAIEGRPASRARRRYERRGDRLPDLHFGIDRGAERAWRSPIAPWSICCAASRIGPASDGPIRSSRSQRSPSTSPRWSFSRPCWPAGRLRLRGGRTFRTETVCSPPSIARARRSCKARPLRGASCWRLASALGRDFKMLCGGEALPRDLAEQLLEGGGALWNMYGPTETTVWSSCGEVLAGKRSDHDRPAHREHAAARSRPLRPACAVRRAWPAAYRRRWRRQGVFPAR